MATNFHIWKHFMVCMSGQPGFTKNNRQFQTNLTTTVESTIEPITLGTIQSCQSFNFNQNSSFGKTFFSSLNHLCLLNSFQIPPQLLWFLTRA